MSAFIMRRKLNGCKKYFNWHFQGIAKYIIDAKNRATAPKGTRFLHNTRDLIVEPLDIYAQIGGRRDHVSGNSEIFYSLDQNRGTQNVATNYSWNVKRIFFYDIK